MPPLWFLQELEDRKRRRDAGQVSRSRPSTAPQSSSLARQAATNSARQAVAPSIGQYNVPSPIQSQQRPDSGTQTTTSQPGHVANTGASRTNQHNALSTSQNAVSGPSRQTPTATSRPTTPVFGQNIATSFLHPPTVPRAGRPSNTQPTSSQSQPQSQPQLPSRTHSKHKKVDSGAHVDFPPRTTNPKPTDTSSTTRSTHPNPDLDPENPFRDPSPTPSSTPTATEPLLHSTQPTGEGNVGQNVREELVLLEPFYKSAWRKMKKGWRRMKEKRNERRGENRGTGTERTRGRGGRFGEEMEGGYDGFYMMAD